MPNWCNNNITIEGPKEKIKAIWDQVQADPDKGFFQHLVPAPKELDGTTSPTPEPGWANSNALNGGYIVHPAAAGPASTKIELTIKTVDIKNNQ